MAIHFITGRPGAGKGLYTMKLVVEELRSTNRPIITNFPILKPKLAEYMQEEFGQTFDILTRIILLESREDLTNFYRVRKENKDGTLHFLDVENDSKGKAVSYDIDGAQDGGVYYVLDEVHIVFGARDWQEMGRAVLFYASQHRKLGDDVILISQVPKNVDSQFRGIAQDFSTIRNHGMEKFLMFKQPSMFARMTYMNMPTGTRDQPLEQSYFRLNLKQANCYETARGVGLGPKDGAKADKGQDRRKGLHIFWIVPIFLTIGVGLIYALKFGSAAGAKAMTSVNTEQLAKAAEQNKNKRKKAVDKSGTNRVSVSLPAGPPQAKVAVASVKEDVAEILDRSQAPARATILSYQLVPEGGGFDLLVTTSDGRFFSLGEGSLKSVGTEFVTTNEGEKLYFLRRFNLPAVLRDVHIGHRARSREP